MSLKIISERFRRFAIRECRGSSELYEQLSLNVAEDEEILRLASAARSGQPIPNLLFGAVHYLWMQALIWPEHKERRELFQKAARCLPQTPVRLLEEDGIALLPNMAAAIPEDTIICVFHTHVANQIPDEAKQLLIKQIWEIGQTRDIFHLYNNMWDTKLHLDYFIDGIEHNEIVAETDGHAVGFAGSLITANLTCPPRSLPPLNRV
ncbi:DUF2332 family protein [Parageobacillus toebii]|nr:DUF2332 family protein [Parageobacillus toebii]WMT19117.1 DUF2332 family protein [Parageobacillus toebii]